MSGEQRIAGPKKKPRNLAYSVDEMPPVAVLVTSALQHCAMLVFSMFTALVICQAAGASKDFTTNTLSLGLLVAGLGTMLQARPLGPIGSGYLVPNGTQAAFLGPSILAAKIGGLPLVFGMTIFAGLVQALLSRFWHRLRGLLPAEVAGLVIILISLQIANVGLDALLEPVAGKPPTQMDWAISALTLLTIVALNVWTSGSIRQFCVLIGVAVGSIASFWLGVGQEGVLSAIDQGFSFSVPRLAATQWAFDPSLIGPFIVVGLATVMSTSANVIIAQRLNDAEWVRPDLSSVGRGTLTDGLTAASAGLLGSCGVGTIATSVGVTVATGVASRYVAYAFGALTLVLSCVPSFSALLAATPKPVLGSALLFASAFTMMSGMQIITSRMLDARKTIAIGLGIATALATLVHPELAMLLPDPLQPLAQSSLVAGTAVGLVLTAVFRPGVRRRVSLKFMPDQDFASAIEEFAAVQGASWGARLDIIARAQFGLIQTVEAVFEHCDPQGPVEVTASFDEFNLDANIIYNGELLEMPNRRPSDDEIMESEDGARRLAGFMLRRNADRVEAARQNGSSRIRLHFDH
jgi:xanthine permease XanP